MAEIVREQVSNTLLHDSCVSHFRVVQEVDLADVFDLEETVEVLYGFPELDNVLHVYLRVIRTGQRDRNLHIPPFELESCKEPGQLSRLTQIFLRDRKIDAAEFIAAIRGAQPPIKNEYAVEVRLKNGNRKLNLCYHTSADGTDRCRVFVLDEQTFVSELVELDELLPHSQAEGTDTVNRFLAFLKANKLSTEKVVELLLANALPPEQPVETDYRTELKETVEVEFA